MQLFVHPASNPAPRSPADVRAMALAVQANLVQLKVADCKRRGVPADQHDIKVPAPGFVRDFRETLIDHAVLAAYPDEFVQLRLREVWGQFCMMLWLFGYPDPPTQASFPRIGPDAELRCGTVLEAKHAEVHALLWLLRFEQRRRHDEAYRNSPEFARHQSLAAEIPGRVFGRPLDQTADLELLQAACEYAGMLAAVRWAMGKVAQWGDEAAMSVSDGPFG